MLLDLLGLIMVGLRALRKKFFASLMSKLANEFNRGNHAHKCQVLQPLNEDIERRRREGGTFKLLEIGGGSGANLEYLDHPVDWTVVEPNLEFSKYLKDNVEKRMKVKHNVSDMVEAYGEDLSMFSDNSFDAVLMTLVLCSVSDADRCLAEIRRVLKPGGAFYFMEHVASPRGSGLRRLQDLLSNCGFWPLIGDGCYLNRETWLNLESAGFAKLELEEYCTDTGGLPGKLVRPLIKGRGIKRK